MKRAISYILIAMVLLPMASRGQDLATEITVDRTVLPEQRQANRPALLPSLLSIENQDVRLTPAEYTLAGSITPLVTTLPAAQWQSAIERTPYRGYASIGYFPALNLNLNAGYRILDTDRLTVGVWGQGTAERYKFQGVRMEQGFASVGAYGSYRVDDYSLASAEIGYTYSSIAHPLARNLTFERCGNNFYRGRLGWVSSQAKFSYKLTLKYDCFNMGHLSDDWNPVFALNRYNYAASLGQDQISLDGNIGLTQEQGAAPWVALDVDAQWMSTNHGYGNQGQYHLTPYVHWRNDIVYATVGATVSFGSGDDDPSSHISPHVRLAYAPQESLLKAWISITGIDKLNPLHDLYMQNHYISPYVAYGRTNVPLDIEGAVTLGCFYGVSLEAFGGYKLGRNALMPMLWRAEPTSSFNWDEMRDIGAQWLSVYGGPVMEGYDVNSWHAGIKLSYAYRDIAEVEAKAETGGSNRSEVYQKVTWLEWNDRAKYVVEAALKVTPIEHLTVNMGFQWRGDRRLPCYDGTWNLLNLKDVANLSLGGEYHITSSLSAMLQLSNLLGHRYLDTASLPSQGVHGLAGISYKF